MASTPARTERGAAFVEFVLVVPFFMALLFGLISYGVMLSFRQTMSQAAVEGARTAAVAPSNLTFAQRRDRGIAAINEAFVGGIGGPLTCGTGGLTCDVPAVPVTCGDANHCISVKLTYAYRDNPRVVVPGLSLTLPATLTYTASARID